MLPDDDPNLIEILMDYGKPLVCFGDKEGLQVCREFVDYAGKRDILGAVANISDECKNLLEEIYLTSSDIRTHASIIFATLPVGHEL